MKTRFFILLCDYQPRYQRFSTISGGKALHFASTDIFKNLGADASKSPAEFEIKLFLPSPTTGKVMELER